VVLPSAALLGAVCALAAGTFLAREIRKPEQLHGLDGLIIPGGESTTIARLLLAYDLHAPLRRRGAAGLPIWGTCAGAILLADDVPGLDRPPLGLLPMTVFLVMSLIAFATASFWGILAVAFPIVMPLATSVGADIPIVVGAMISASACGSHACFYGDSTVLSAHGSGCGAVEHALTQLPYVIIGALLAALGYLFAAL